MLDMYDESKVKSTRRPHYCELCNRTIPKKFSAHFIKGHTEDGFFNYYLCNTCYEITKDYKFVCLNDDNELCTDYLYDYMSDYKCKTPYQLLLKCKKGEINDR